MGTVGSFSYWQEANLQFGPTVMCHTEAASPDGITAVPVGM